MSLTELQQRRIEKAVQWAVASPKHNFVAAALEDLLLALQKQTIVLTDVQSQLCDLTTCHCEPETGYICSLCAYKDLLSSHHQLQREFDEQRRSVPQLQWVDSPIDFDADTDSVASMAEQGDALLIIMYRHYDEVYSWSIQFSGTEALRRSDIAPKTLGEAKKEAENALFAMFGVKT